MKITLTVLLIFALIFSGVTLKSQDVIDVLAESMAKNVVKKMKKMPDDTKIAISFFLYEDEYTDTIKTYLSIKLSKSFAQYIRLQIQNNKLDQKILFPSELDNELYESMQGIYTIPDDVDEAEYWKEFLDNQTPDYYLVGKYSIVGDYESIQLKSVQLVPSPYGKYVKEQALAITNVVAKVKKQSDKTSLLKLNQSLNILSQTYTNLVNWEGDGDFMTLKLIDNNSRTVDNYELIVGEEYQISITLKEDAYVYAFYYDPQDKDFPFISMLYPFQKSQDTFLKAGLHSIPPGHTFMPDPPAEGQVFIKIFASKEKLPITFIEETDSEGYIISKFNDKNCTDFQTKLNSVSSEKIASRQITLLRTEK
jgi:hypothetical protein